MVFLRLWWRKQSTITTAAARLARLCAAGFCRLKSQREQAWASLSLPGYLNRQLSPSQLARRHILTDERKPSECEKINPLCLLCLGPVNQVQLQIYQSLVTDCFPILGQVASRNSSPLLVILRKMSVFAITIGKFWKLQQIFGCQSNIGIIIFMQILDMCFK